MRRFSQRSALVTLSEINITPLLDLAFVLLIIFVITTPLLEQSLPLNLPKGGGPDPKLGPKDIRTVEVSLQGGYRLNKTPMTLAQLERTLVSDFRTDPNMVVAIRADEMGRWKDVAAVLDCCQRNGITKIACKTEPPKRK
jgi:biopolymer transport protein ExbD